MRLLLLAGTAESRQLASAFASRRQMSVVVSIAAPARRPQAFGLPSRIGGFGGEAGFRDYLDREGIGAVLDATHPFAAGISHRSARICAETGRPYLYFLRPAWRPVPGDDWTFAEDEADAARAIPDGARVLVATGRGSLEGFGPMAGSRVYVRRLGPAPSEPPPFADGHWLSGAPPFSPGQEAQLMRGLGIDWLVTRNAGGAASRPKLDAAREVGVRVAMIRRPPQPEAPRVDTISAAVAWVARLSRGA